MSSTCRSNFRPPAQLVERSDKHLESVEGHALERLVAKLYEERGRKGLPGFAITSRVAGYWDGGEAEIDLVALNEEDEVVRFGTIKRDPSRLAASFPGLKNSVEIFLNNHTRLSHWRQEFVAIAPRLSDSQRAHIESCGVLPQDLPDLWQGLEP